MTSKRKYDLGLNFISILCTAFTLVDPKSVKDTYDLTVLFSAKAVRRMLMKLTPELNFINVLHTAFTLVVPKSVKIQLSHKYLFTLLGSTGAKAAGRTLMKLTPDFSTLLFLVFQQWLTKMKTETSLKMNFQICRSSLSTFPGES
jgi:hypothetical protein